MPVGRCSTEIVMMIRMIMMSTFIAHDSINLNAQCTKRKGGGGGGGDREMQCSLTVLVNYC